MFSRRILAFPAPIYFCVGLALVLTLAPLVRAATAPPSETADYDSAASQLLTQGKVTALEIFVEDHPNSQLKKDALELLLYAYQQDDRLDKVASMTYQLLRIDSANAPALAVMADSAEQLSQMKPQRPEDLKRAREVASRGLLALPSFASPRGVDPMMFENMKAQTKSMLDADLGVVALRSKDYLTAQAHLRSAVGVTPNDANRLYSLARSYLLADPPNHSEGMWFLARVANLAGGTQLGRQADSNGRKLSRTLYRSAARWQELLQLARLNAFPEDSISPQLTPDAPNADVSPTADPATSAAGAASARSARRAADNANNRVLLRVRVALLDNNQKSRAIPNVEMLLRRLDSSSQPYLGPLLTDNSGTAEIALPAGRYELVTPHGVSAGEKWLTWNLEVPASEPRNHVELSEQNATDVDSSPPSPKQPPLFPSRAALSQRLTSSGAHTQNSAQSPLKAYAAVLVKRFLVEEDKDTARFRGGDEALLQEFIIARLRRYTSFKNVFDTSQGQQPSPAQPANSAGGLLTLAGTVVKYKTEGRIKRNVLGLVGGMMTLSVRFVFRDAQSGEEVLSTELTANGGPVFFGGNTDEMYSQAMLRLADSFIKLVERNR